MNTHEKSGEMACAMLRLMEKVPECQDRETLFDIREFIPETAHC